MKRKWLEWRERRRRERILKNVAKLSSAWSEYEDLMRASGKAAMLKVARRDLIAGRFRVTDWLAS